jgi:hypothetical protein
VKTITITAYLSDDDADYVNEDPCGNAWVLIGNTEIRPQTVIITE